MRNNAHRSTNLGLADRARAMLAQRALLRRLPASRWYCTPAARAPAVHLEDDQEPGVKIMTLDRPDSLNAMTVEMGDAVQAAVSELSSLGPDQLRALVLTGRGRAFSAGGDMRFLDDRKADNPTSNAQTMLGFYKRFLSIRSLPVPIICCINGPAIGAGACFAMASDVRYTHSKAKIGFTFVGLGLHPGMGATHSLAAAAGPQVASRLLLSGDVLSGDDAAAAGLVAASLPDAPAALAEATALARRVAAQSPLAVRATLRTLRVQADAELERRLQREADAQAQSYASADYAEGLSAVRAKRTPSFGGA